MTHLFLFDVDSVLVEATGYLVALQHTVDHFSRRMGVGEQSPTETEIRTFEALGLGCEWDTAAICLAVLLVERLRCDPALALPADWEAALAFLAAHPCALPHQDYVGVAERVVSAMGEGQAVGQTARAVLLKDVQAIPGVLASEPVAALLDTLLCDTYDFYTAPATRHFQHLAIGSRGVATTYRVKPDFESCAYLERYDEPLLNNCMHRRLQSALAADQVRAAIYTARPSLPPAGIDGPAVGYSPEAEIARALLDLESCPLIGKGRLQWLANGSHQDVERLVKPSPVQALAALAAAWSGEEPPALVAALALIQQRELRPPLSGMGPVVIHVFEDTVGGLSAVERAVAALRTAGVAASYQPYGVVPPQGAKAAAMRARHVPVHPSVNDALAAAFERVVAPLRRNAEAPDIS